MKPKLKLSELRVDSFITHANEVKGGFFATIADECTLYPVLCELRTLPETQCSNETSPQTGCP